ncbi:hypothetical protein [Methyloradius palustris]|uniref:Uncharacterized protein n=1 Tax=Methyloradius palustris TaxID=2778876 RepID=A0A8D5JW56_9PROT|nr:hypothetical protein [Methyloradius palustris]BCM24749.1 hypothetical protein ZMTM_10080 [Methyloradius palustris]
MQNELLTNALAHEFQRCRDAFNLFAGLHLILATGNQDKKIAIASYNAYSDFVSHLYEFYLGCIRRDGRFPKHIKGAAVDKVLNNEVKKLLNIRRDRILRGDAPSYENDISTYQVEVPEEFGLQFRSVRNIRSHASSDRSQFNLAIFYFKYHKFIYLLFEEPHWLWDIDKFPEHNWYAIEEFSKTIVRQNIVK